MPAASSSVNLCIWRLLVTVAVLCGLYFLQDIILPLAVAALVTFILSPVVSWLEKRVGRTFAVLASITLTTVIFGVFAWICTVQILDLARKLPSYKANLVEKARSLNSTDSGPLGGVSKMIDEIARETAAPAPAAVPGSVAAPLKVEVIEHPRQSPARLLTSAGYILAPLGTLGVVVILSVFMLFKRDDLRDRIIGLIGRGHIGGTTLAMRDAARRVNQFLLMNLLVNVSYGVPVGIGLYFIGVPSAALWAVLAIVLRFIPYVGPLVAMAFPIMLSLAVFDNWTGPALTIALFLALELISNNVIEPWLYGSSTGVSTFALIVAALFWTWLWGPVGLLLSTPLTVCLLVMGKHVPQLATLGILLSDEGALQPHEICYHRLLAADRGTINQVVAEQIRRMPLEAVYGATLLPALALVEDDFQRRALDGAQHDSVVSGLREVVDQLEATASTPPQTAPSEGTDALPPDGTLPPVALRIVCVPAESAADEVSALMLAHAARTHGLEAESISSRFHIGETRLVVAERRPDWVWICAVNPAGVSRCRHLTVELRRQIPDLRVSIGVWHPQEQVASALPSLQQSGASSISTAFGDALLQMEALRASFSESFVAAPMPDNEAERLTALLELGLLNPERDELFDRATTELTKIFEVPIALVSIVDSGWQHFASQCGLPADLTTEGCTPRNVSVCGHVVAANRPFVIEDLARDRRFAGNPLLRQRNLRFYAGVPLRTSSGLAVGSLCIIDTRPRTISEREVRLMQMIAESLMSDVEERAAERLAGASAPGATAVLPA